jgi:putative manganese-dependent inorganic pyrophosphatase
MNNVVMSYPNPDTDGVACIIAVARYYDFLPVIHGHMNSETRYVLEKVGLELPNAFDKIENVEKIILVDTHHLAQIGTDFPTDKVVKIIDHHSGGDDMAFINAEIDNREIGSAASIVGEMFLHRKHIEENICKLLQYAIVSNTLDFSAPSTTRFDKDVFLKLNSMYPVSDSELRKMLYQRKSAGVADDTKYFKFRDGRIAIVQIEEFGLNVSVNEVKHALDILDKRDELLFSVFNGVDFGKQESIVIFSSRLSDMEATNIFSFKVREGVHRANKILLRKTDFVPMLVHYQEQNKM